MAFFTNESLANLRSKVDLAELLGSYIEFKRTGASKVALCPFHDEKTPSFHVNKGDTHYHCFGCGAHGDAIQFLIDYQKLSFTEAVQTLAQRFNVQLEYADDGKGNRVDFQGLKAACEKASHFFHFLLLESPQAKEARAYLAERGIDEAFIRKYHIGYAPKEAQLLRKALNEARISNAQMIEAGLLKEQEGRVRDFFIDRITFPIHNAQGQCIGFSARKYKEETFGGKYVNTSETPLFKKSHVLFGLHLSRRRIAKEGKAIIVEGQIDALRMIDAGFDYTVASQGTAFGIGHVKELVHLGVREVYLCFDADLAGCEAALKVGNLFQHDSVVVKIVRLPPDSDPDEVLRKDGKATMQGYLDTSKDYLSCLVAASSKKFKADTPAGKNQMVQALSEQIRSWADPVMIHESLKALAKLTGVPESTLAIDMAKTASTYIRLTGTVDKAEVNADRILEEDMLRWLLLMGSTHPNLAALAKSHIKPTSLRDPDCRAVFELYFAPNTPTTLLGLLSVAPTKGAASLIQNVLSRQVNREKAEAGLTLSIQKILERNWLAEKASLLAQMSAASEEQQLSLAKQYQALATCPSI